MIHHPKKPNGDYGPPKLERDNAMEWLYQALERRALINQTDTRIAIESTTKGDAALVMVWNHKVQGVTGPVFLTRVFDEDDEPIGYDRLIGSVALLNKDQQELFEKLGSTFSFTEAKHAYGRRGQATTDFLRKCIDLQDCLRRWASCTGRCRALPNRADYEYKVFIFFFFPVRCPNGPRRTNRTASPSVRP